jgi:CRISPR/Cas system-associated endonuclease Cas3-HD
MRSVGYYYEYSSFMCRCGDLSYQPLLAALNETLEKHIKDVTNELTSCFLKKRAYTLTRLLRAHHINISLSDAKNVLLYSVIFHDIGKAFDWFQNRIIEAINRNSQNFSVPRHELFSAFATMRILTENAFTNFFQLLRDCILLSIVWSHSATRGMVLPKIMYTTPDFVKVKSVYLSERGKLEIMSILNSILAEYECEAGIDLLKLPTEISINEVEGMLKTLHKSLNNNLLLYYVTLPVLSSLQIIDSLVAHKNRGGKPQVHIIDLPNPSVIDKVREALWSIKQ